MEYKNVLDLLSENILSLKGSNESLSPIISNGLDNMKVYKNNYLQLCFSNFSKDFPATKKHVGDNNFLFLTRTFLLDKGLKSANIFNSSEEFLFYLKSLDICKEDELLADLALIDFLWAYGKINEIKITHGLLQYWEELVSDKKSTNKINLTKMDTIKLIEVDGVRGFKLEKS